MSESYKTVTLNLTNDNLETAKKTAQELGINVTVLINNAIQTELFFQEAKAKGEKILVEDRNGNLRQVILR